MNRDRNPLSLNRLELEDEIFKDIGVSSNDDGDSIKAWQTCEDGLSVLEFFSGIG